MPDPDNCGPWYRSALTELDESHKAELENALLFQSKAMLQTSNAQIQVLQQEIETLVSELAARDAEIERLKGRSTDEIVKRNELLERHNEHWVAVIREKEQQLAETKAKLATLDETNHGLFKDLLAQQDLNAKLREALTKIHSECDDSIAPDEHGAAEAYNKALDRIIGFASDALALPFDQTLLERITKTITTLIDTMEMQEKREIEQFHIPQDVAICLWNDAKDEATALLAELRPNT